MNYSKLLRDYRAKELLSQTELAEILGVSFVSVNRWENGHHEPTIKVKRKIRKLLLKAGMWEE
jgi:DNA-binding XRE family transcriptional regulator